jgi:hypothetical protein
MTTGPIGSTTTSDWGVRTDPGDKFVFELMGGGPISVACSEVRYLLAGCNCWGFMDDSGTRRGSRAGVTAIEDVGAAPKDLGVIGKEGLPELLGGDVTSGVCGGILRASVPPLFTFGGGCWVGAEGWVCFGMTSVGGAWYSGDFMTSSVAATCGVAEGGERRAVLSGFSGFVVANGGPVGGGGSSELPGNCCC